MRHKYFCPSCAVITTEVSGDASSVARSSSDNFSAVFVPEVKGSGYRVQNLGFGFRSLRLMIWGLGIGFKN
jgi:hypothetical protein